MVSGKVVLHYYNEDNELVNICEAGNRVTEEALVSIVDFITGESAGERTPARLAGKQARITVGASELADDLDIRAAIGRSADFEDVVHDGMTSGSAIVAFSVPPQEVGYTPGRFKLYNYFGTDTSDSGDGVLFAAIDRNLDPVPSAYHLVIHWYISLTNNGPQTGEGLSLLMANLLFDAPDKLDDGQFHHALQLGAQSTPLATAPYIYDGNEGVNTDRSPTNYQENVFEMNPYITPSGLDDTTRVAGAVYYLGDRLKSDPGSVLSVPKKFFYEDLSSAGIVAKNGIKYDRRFTIGIVRSDS